MRAYCKVAINSDVVFSVMDGCAQKLVPRLMDILRLISTSSRPYDSVPFVERSRKTSDINPDSYQMDNGGHSYFLGVQ
jgi:hypothetical protein